jgi:hypothetical protein
MPTNLLPYILIVAITAYQTRKFEVLCPISGRKKHKMRFIVMLGSVYPYGMDGRFSYV